MTVANSVNRTLQLNDKPENIVVVGGLRYYYDEYTFTAAMGAVAHTVFFAALPAGKIRIIPHLSKIFASDGNATANYHLGYDSYLRVDKVTVVADDNFWIDNADVGAADLNGVITSITGVTAAGAVDAEFNTLKGLTPTVLIDTADLNIGNVLRVQFVYSVV